MMKALLMTEDEIQELKWDHAILLDYAANILNLQDNGDLAILSQMIVKSLEPYVREIIQRKRDENLR